MGVFTLLKKYRIAAILCAITTLAFALRMIYFGDATFGYDQARDAFVGTAIFTHDHIKLLGPSSDVKGLFHGSLYWYLTAPFYFFSKGDPLYARMFLVVVNLLNIFFIYFISKKLFKNTFVAVTSAFLFAVSFEAVQYARWISNPSMALLTVAGFYWGLWLTIHKKPYGVGIMLLGAAASMQFEIFLVYLSLFFLFALGYYLSKAKLKTLFTKANYYLTGGALLLYAPFIIAELKFKFQATMGLLGFFTHGNSEVKDANFFYGKLVRFIESLYGNIHANIINFDLRYATGFFIALALFILWIILSKRKERGVIIFLFLWLISPGLFYIFEKNNSYFLNIGNIYPLLMLTSFALWTLVNKLPQYLRIILVVLVLGTITLSNGHLIVANNKHGETLLSVQTNITLSGEKEALDWMYSQSSGQPFSFNAITNPLFVNTTWSYLFDWYGRGRYGYVPSWFGYPQTGNYGDAVVYSPNTEKEGRLHFLIIEPITGIPFEHILGYRRFEDQRSTLLESKKIEGFVVEKRVMKNTKHFSREEMSSMIPPDLLKLDPKELKGLIIPGNLRDFYFSGSRPSRDR